MKDKVVIVTGATKGMGFATAKHLLELGSKVVLVYRSDEKTAEAVASQLSSYSSNMLLLKADITNSLDRSRILDDTVATFGRIDVLVNNAGVAAKSGFLKTTEEEYDAILDVNLKAPIFLAQLVANQMIDQGDGGSIINFSSTSGHRPTGGISYDAAKAGVIRASEAMAVAVGKYGIRVNTISPGGHKTEMNRYHWENNTELLQNVIEATPLKRFADAAEIAGTVVFLASDQSSYITGTDIIADGGYICVNPGR
ncbi:MAG: putative oxidoreductase YohF [Chlamydiia bacterium]|nr:putative oxidoreductase YohF [Chlamydiia bacterium]MCH9617965.1 putative oxidoreductase YohF [Chlamydiia bacterium]MCH9623710.1 putative oxidoreductase YohF [Chlamydiia bacterium]